MSNIFLTLRNVLLCYITRLNHLVNIEDNETPLSVACDCQLNAFTMIPQAQSSLVYPQTDIKHSSINKLS